MLFVYIKMVTMVTMLMDPTVLAVSLAQAKVI